MDIKEQIGQRITQSRKALGITIKELSNRVGTLSPARISNWEQCTRSPGPLEAKLLAQHLNVSAAYLLCLTDNPQGELLLPAKNSMRYAPILTLKDAPHAKSFQNSDKKIVVDSFNQSPADAFLYGVLVEDNSMQPELNAGDLVIVNADRTPCPGDLVVAYLVEKHQTVLRKYGEAEDCLFQLLSSNPLWGRVNVKRSDEVVVCGVGVEVRKYL